jgi:hypothetical protein
MPIFLDQSISINKTIKRAPMHDIIDIIKNVQTLSENNDAFKVLKDFERVLDELDIYVFKNWEEGELLAGPDVNRYSVTCSFMWPKEEMPDPEGGQRLNEYGCKVIYKKTHILIPRKIKSPADYRPGTKKGKIDAHPVWVVEITMPKKLMQDVYIGKENQEHNKMAEFMKYRKDASASAEANEVAQESPENAEATETPAA